MILNFVAKSCGDGWQKASGSSMCYKKFNEQKNFVEAERECNVLGGHLARISTLAENELVGIIGGSDHFRIGLWTGDTNKCTEERNGYIWADGTPNTGFNSWRSGEPDCAAGPTMGEAAFFNYNGKNLWDDGRISSEKPFVCGMLEQDFGK